MVKSATQGQGTTQGIEIGEKLLWKYEESHNFEFYPWSKDLHIIETEYYFQVWNRLDNSN